MTSENETKQKAEELIKTVNHRAASSLESFLTRFPEIKTLMQNRTENDWIYYMTVGGTAAAVMMNRKLTAEESNEIVQSLSNWNANATLALNELLGFIDKNVKSGLDHFSALGRWVLMHIIDDQPSTEQTMLADVIGVFLRDSFKEAW